MAVGELFGGRSGEISFRVFTKFYAFIGIYCKDIISGISLMFDHIMGGAPPSI